VFTTTAVLFGEPWREGGSVVVNSLLLFAGLGALFAAPPLRAFLKRLPAPHRVIAGVVLGALVFGHLVGESRVTFPFPRWDMFTWVYEPRVVIFHEVYGVDGAGARQKLNLARLLSSLHSTFYWHFEQWGESTRKDPALRAHYATLLRALGELYNERNPDSPIEAVLVERRAITLRKGGRLQVEAVGSWRADLEPEPTP
jgi:hypothetical protein